MNGGPGAPGLVCIGSSAGGLASLKSIVRALPADFPWPVLVKHHFPADVQSHLPEILATQASLAVHEAVDGERLSPGVVLISPSNANLGVGPDRRVTLQPRKRGPPNGVDHLFTTAANVAGPAVVVVVLSGAGWDGASGSKIVKKSGGKVIAESPETAEWGGMPAAAISAGPVDEILPNNKIGPALIRLTAKALAKGPPRS